MYQSHLVVVQSLAVSTLSSIGWEQWIKIFLLGIQLKINCEAMKCIKNMPTDMAVHKTHKTDASTYCEMFFPKGDKAWNKCNKVWKSARVKKSSTQFSFVLLEQLDYIDPPRPLPRFKQQKRPQISPGSSCKSTLNDIKRASRSHAHSANWRLPMSESLQTGHIPLVDHIFVSPAVLKLLQKLEHCGASQIVCFQDVWRRFKTF